MNMALRSKNPVSYKVIKNYSCDLTVIKFVSGVDIFLSFLVFIFMC